MGQPRRARRGAGRGGDQGCSGVAVPPLVARRGRGVAGGSGMRIPEGPAGRGDGGHFAEPPRCSKLWVWGNCPRVPSAVTAG